MSYLRFSSESPPPPNPRPGEPPFSPAAMAALHVPPGVTPLEAAHARNMSRIAERERERSRQKARQQSGATRSAPPATGPSTWRSRIRRPARQRLQLSNHERRDRLNAFRERLARIERQTERLQQELEEDHHHHQPLAELPVYSDHVLEPGFLSNHGSGELIIQEPAQTHQHHHQEQMMMEPVSSQSSLLQIQPPRSDPANTNNGTTVASVEQSSMNTMPSSFGNILEEAARRAQLAVLERDMGGVSL